ncbi:hypothetical protein K1T71_005174 [Dendrolimus kikuchii]|uniref:Uncharacterized protein n=1 Tax=Dendrolimus kikuchii TaxID=765133 RepID=A0ACC1D6L1_9NEOP|nr:hypothetical protein K1T71_005174 [Dendrolimus kikuchii]
MTSFVEDPRDHDPYRLFYPLVILASSIWLLYRWQQSSRYYKLGNKIPGPFPLPLFGNVLMAIGKSPDQFVKLGMEYGEKYGNVMRGWFGSKLIIVLTDAVDAEIILNSHIHIDKAAEYKFFKPWLGDGLLISTGEKWRSHRKMIAPTFHINILKSFIDVFNQNSKNVVEKMRPEVGKTFDVHDYMSATTVDILLETAMGITKKTQNESGFDYAMAVMDMCDIIHQRHYKFWLRLESFFKLTSTFKKQLRLLNIIHGLTNKVIRNKKETYLRNKNEGFIPTSINELINSEDIENVLANDAKTLSDAVFKGYRDDLDFNDENDVGAKKRLAFLDLMIESAQNGTNKISDKEIKEEVDTIMFEGHDTTAAGSSFVLCLLGVHQDIQQKVYNELYEIFGDSDRSVTFDDTLRMKYLERVILETLRLYPPVPIIARKLNQDVKIVTNNYVLPAGATVIIGTFKIHRLAKYYKNPNEFNPDNFLPENASNRHYYSYIPFSAGPRSCVGRKYALLKLKCDMTSFVDESQSFNFNSRLIFYPLLFIASGIWIYIRWQHKSKLFNLGEKLPGPARVPFFGNALIVLRKKPSELIELGLQYAEQFGNVIRVWFGSKLVIFLADADDIEVILNSQVHINKSTEYRFFKPWLGEGLLISSGDKWRSHRKMIAPTFHINILKSFVNVFNQNSKNVVEKMRPEIGKTFDVHDYMSEVTVDILLETAMGITRKTQDASGFDYAMAVMKMCDIIHQRHYKLWMRIDSIFNLTPIYKKQKQLLSIIHGLTNKVIKNKKETYLENKAKGIIPPTLQQLTSSTDSEGVLANDAKTLSDTVFKGYRDDLDFNDENDIGEKKRLAFLDLMIESAQNGTHNISDHEIKEEVDTIMFEGHDTTAAGSSFVLCLLGVHQAIQQKVYDELYEIFGDSDRLVTFEDTLRMKYLERVILESLRMYPPVPMIARQLTRDVKIRTNNYVLPSGATVAIATFKLHRNPKYYKNPNVFNPDNFLPENTQNRHYYSYVPFSAGPRSCVGRKYALLKLKILLATILRNYKSVSDITEDKFQLQGDIILKRSDGFRIKIEPRHRVPSSAKVSA